MNTPVVNFQPSAAGTSVIRVMLLLVDGVSLTTVSSALEPFQQANSCLKWNTFEIQLVSLDGKDPTTRAGIPIPCHASSDDVLAPGDTQGRPDLVILCCGLSIDAVSQRSLQIFARKLARAGTPFFALGAACEVIAHAGMINDKTCAAHWKILAPMVERFPDVNFDSVLYVTGGRFTSCAGELATFDLIVDFIERVCGPGVAGEICNHFLACGKRSGTSLQSLLSDALICDDERFQRALEIMIDNIETPISTAELSRRLGLSTRQVERVFSKNGFLPPLKYYVRLRLNRARQLLEQTRMSLTEIAIACGFENQASFGKNYKRVFGESPNATRGRKPPAQVTLFPGN